MRVNTKETLMSSFKVVITDFSHPDQDIEAAELRAAGLDVQLIRLNIRLPEPLIPHVVDADALMVQWATINRQLIEALTRCKVIARYGIGVDMVDLQAASERGIPVANVPDFCIEEVSTHTVAFILMLNRHVLLHHQHVRAGKWDGVPGGAPSRLVGQTLGIIGLGNIGRAVARKAGCLGLQLLAYDPYVSQEAARELGVCLVELADLLRRSDYVSLHCPLNEETRHLIGAEELALMKPTAYLINMARGPIVDQRALYQALSGGTIRGAALDVLDQEPPAPDEPLLQLENVIFTPHISSWSAESLVQLRRDTARNVAMALQGRLPRSTVNRRALGLDESRQDRVLRSP
jgi:D-3-phosphoglycerate dehydrogenase